MKIGVHSDLHSECSLCTISNLAELDVLVLAGDIGDPATVPLFFDYLRRKAPKLPVLYVLGNHEYYGFALNEAKDLYRSICQKYDITLLDDDSITLDGVQFIGSTLWTDFSLGGDADASMRWAGRTLPDFREIYDEKGRPLTPETMRMLHQVSRAYIETALDPAAEARVVISHFVPRLELVAKRHYTKAVGLLHSAYWTTHLPELTTREPVDLRPQPRQHQHLHRRHPLRQQPARLLAHLRSGGAARLQPRVLRADLKGRASLANSP